MSTYRSLSPYSLKDKTEVRDYIETINKSVQNLFNSLNPDDNFTEEELNKYHEIWNHIALTELTEDHFKSAFANRKSDVESEISVASDEIALKVRSGDLVNQLNIEPDAINISGNRLHISTQNFIVSDDKMYARGNITALAGNIAGWNIGTKGDYHYWTGNASSKIDVGTIHADSGTVGTVNAYGSVTLKATFAGNFDTITVNGATFEDLSCSCMQDDGDRFVYAGNMRVYKSFRDPGDPKNPSVSHPNKEDFPEDSLIYKNPTRYDDNELPVGGINLSGEAYCTSIYSSSNGKTWSDARLKKNIHPVSLVDSLLLLETLKPCSFDFIDTKLHSNGFIAQETPEFYQSKIEKYDSKFTKTGHFEGVRTTNDYYGLKYRSIACTLDTAMIRMTERLKEALHES